MRWSDRATQTLDLVLRDIEPEKQEIVRKHTIEETERYCQDARFNVIGSDQVVIGFIRATPSHLRMGLKNSLRFKGIIVEKFEPYFQGA